MWRRLIQLNRALQHSCRPRAKCTSPSGPVDLTHRIAHLISTRDAPSLSRGDSLITHDEQEIHQFYLNQLRTVRTSHGKIPEKAIHAATQPHAGARLAPPQGPRRRVLHVQQGRGRAAHHKKGRALHSFPVLWFPFPLIWMAHSPSPHMYARTHARAIHAPSHVYGCMDYVFWNIYIFGGLLLDGERRPRRAKVGLRRRVKLDLQRPVDAASTPGQKRRRNANRPSHGLRGGGRRRSGRSTAVRPSSSYFFSSLSFFPDRKLLLACLPSFFFFF